MKNLYYYSLEDAEAIKSKFNSWIGKRAHVGKGHVDTLKSIVIRPKRRMILVTGSSKLYRIEFEFANRKRFSAHEFLFHNSLPAILNTPFVVNKHSTNAL